MPQSAPLRRTPVQQRSTERVERMLAGCAELIEELGYDGVTTTLIAERAEVAVGSLYQFFPDKRAIVQELSTRNLAQYLCGIQERARCKPFVNWHEAVDAALEVYTTMFQTTPAFSAIRFGDVVDKRLLDDQRDNHNVISDGLVALLVDQFHVPAEHMRLPLAVAVEIVDSTLDLAFRRKRFPIETVVEEARQAVLLYLNSRLPLN